MVSTTQSNFDRPYFRLYIDFFIRCSPGVARIAEILQNCVVRQIFGRMCWIFFLTSTLKLPLSVVPIATVF